jgi:hypothetical protein
MSRMRYNGRVLQGHMLNDVESALHHIQEASQIIKKNPDLAATHIAWIAADLERLKGRIRTDLEQVLQRQEKSQQERKE